MAQRYFDSAFGAAPIGMALFNTDDEYIRVNAALCGMLGRTEDELIGHRDQEFTHPDDRQADGTDLHGGAAIDEAVLTELELVAGDAPLLEVFVTETSNRIDLLDRAVSSGDLTAAAGAAHSLRGSCGAFGARRLGVLSTDLEVACRAGDALAAAALAPAVRSEFDGVCRCLTARLVSSSG